MAGHRHAGEAGRLIADADLDAAAIAVDSAAAASLKGTQAQVVQAQASLNQAQVNLDHAGHRRTHLRHRDAAQCRCRPERGREHDVADHLRHRGRPDQDAGQRPASTNPTSANQPGQAVTVRCRCLPRDHVQGRRAAGATPGDDRVERDDLSDDHRRPQPESKLRPGITANVKVMVATRPDVLRVPSLALGVRPTASCLDGARHTGPGRWCECEAFATRARCGPSRRRRCPRAGPASASPTTSHGLLAPGLAAGTQVVTVIASAPTSTTATRGVATATP